MIRYSPLCLPPLHHAPINTGMVKLSSLVVPWTCSDIPMGFSFIFMGTKVTENLCLGLWTSFLKCLLKSSAHFHTGLFILKDFVVFFFALGTNSSLANCNANLSFTLPFHCGKGGLFDNKSP